MTAPSTSSPARAGVPRPAVLAHIVSLVAAGAFLLWANRDQWFFGDEWDFVAQRSATSLRHLFAPHNEHWVTIPILVYRLLVNTVGLHSYLPFVAVVILLHLAVAAVLWQLLLRTGSDPWIAVGLTCVFLLLGSGAENLLWAFQMTFVGAVLVGLLLLILVNHDGPPGARDVGASALATVGLMLSGVTVTMVAVAAACIALRRGIRQAVAFAAVPSAAYLLWLVAIGGEGLSGSSEPDSLFLLPRYVWRGMSTGLEATTGIPGSGVLLFAALVAFAVMRNGFVRERGAPAAAGVIGTVVLFLVLGLGRSALGVEQAAAPRYIYIEIALLLPVMGLALSALVGSHRGRLVATMLFLGLVLFHNVGLLLERADAEASRELTIKRQVLAAADLVSKGDGIIGLQPEPTFSPNIYADPLRALEQEGRLPDDPYDAVDRLSAAVELQVAIGPVSNEHPAATLITATDVSIEEREEACATVRATGPSAQLVLQVGAQPARLVIDPPLPMDLSITLRSGTPLAAGRSRTMRLAPGPQMLTIAARETSPVVSFPAGQIHVCGLEPAAA